MNHEFIRLRAELKALVEILQYMHTGDARLPKALDRIIEICELLKSPVGSSK